MEKNTVSSISGFVETITFQNSDESFLIGKLKPDNKSKSITFKGSLNQVEIGDNLLLEGVWEEHPQYGKQLRVQHFEKVEPQTKTGIIKYLSSAKFKTVGEKTAEEIVSKFGTASLRILEEEPKKLLDLPLMNETKLDRLIEVHEQQKSLSEVFVFLYGKSLPKNIINKIFEAYGLETIQKIKKNPYSIANDIKGAGFKTADKLAEKLDIPKDSEARAEAALLYFTNELTNEGHTCAKKENFLKIVFDRLYLLDGRPFLSKAALKAALENLIDNQKLVYEDELVFPKKFYYKEQNIAFRLHSILGSSPTFQFENLQSIISSLAIKFNLELHHSQFQAVEEAVKQKVIIITGGPGTGKTTIVRIILDLIQGLDRKILLATPTGKSAKRLAESTMREVKTIHRLLEMDGTSFQRNLERKLECDLLVIDEFSMVDTSLFLSTLNALPDQAHLLLVGDSDQLPSIGAGAVLRDLIESKLLKTVQLTRIFRQAKNSLITLNAHQIIAGNRLLQSDESEELSDFYWIPIPKKPGHQGDRSNPERALRSIKQLFLERIPQKFSIEKQDIQILTAIRKGVLGVENINQEIQQIIYEESTPFVEISEYKVFLGDRVMQTKNNYELNVFNGDQGFVKKIHQDKSIEVDFDGNLVVYNVQNSKDIMPSWAITIHKSQGSEFPAIILIISDLHHMMLYKNLVYTGLTRAKTLAVLIGDESALQKSLETERNDYRFTHLKEKLLHLNQ